MFSPLEQFNIIPLINLIYYLDLSIVNILIPFALILVLVFLTNVYLSEKSTIIPSCFQYYIESLVDFVFVIIKQQIGRDGYVFFPIIFTIFCFILLSNYISLLPAGIALTSHIIVTIFTSFSMCLSIIFLGFITKNIKFFKNFIPHCPFALMPMLILIELFSYALRSFSLAIRLSANILAGHTLVYIISTSILSVISLKSVFIPIMFGFIAPVLVLESCIAFLQAYVFCTLLCLYLREIYAHH